MTGEEEHPRPSSSAVAVAAAKLVVPQIPPGHLPRPRLVQRLAGAGPGSVLLVCAPAGYGKTLLLAEWVGADPRPTAWLSLDDGDDDDRLFWAAVVAAVRACSATPPDSPLHDLALPAVPSRDPDFLPALLGALQDLRGPVRLVLDDVHELTSADPLHGLGRLVRGRPSAVQIVLASRSDPPVHLDRLRLAGELREVRADALAFTFDEASVLMAAIGPRIRDDQLRMVVDQTEGWVAGLRLAALSLRESDDRDRFLTDLVGNGRAISDYLVDEILSRLSDEVRDLLAALSVCDHLTAPLAVALSGQEDAGELLLALERETSLVVSYGEGRRWFRVHRLLLSHLRAEVRRQRPDLLSVLHARAARWFADAQDAVGALRHARAAEDPDLMDELVHRHGLALAALGHHDAIIEALDAASAWRTPGPVAELVEALACVERGDAGAVARHVSRAEAAWPAEPAPRLLALRELVEARRTWTVGPRGAPVPDRSREFTGGSVEEQVVLVVQANAALARGDPQVAEETAKRAADRAISDGNSYTTARSLTILGVAAGMGGDFARMVDLAERAERSAPAERWRSTEGAALNALVRAYGRLLQARPQEGLRIAEGVLGIGTGRSARPPAAGADGVLQVAGVLLAASRFDIGGGPRDLDALRVAREAVPAGAALQAPATIGALLEHGAAVWQHRADRAQEVLGWAEERLGPTGDVVFLRAAGAVAMNRSDAARELLRPLLDGSLAPVIHWVLVEAWLLECDIALALGSANRARSALRRALGAAEEMGVLRPLVYAPPRVTGLLSEQVKEVGAVGRVARSVLAVGWARERTPPLTPREIAVLTLLPTQLALDEIAQDLGVSVNTVKSHARAVYGKLGADSRRSAVAAARARGLIEPPATP